MRERLLISLLFAALFGVRLIVSFSSPEFSPDAYFHIRMIEYIADHGVPMTYDSLSYGGRALQFSPLFHYVLAIFSWFLPLDVVLRFFPQLFISSLTLIVFIITHKLTQNGSASLFSASLAAVVPVFFRDFYSLSPLSLTLPLIFLSLYVFLHIEKKLYDLHFILLVAAASLTHPLSIVLVIALLGYLLICTLEKMELARSEIELLLFSTFLFIWIQFLLYKKPLLLVGIGGLIATYSTLPVPDIFLSLGIIPMIGGILCMYKYLFRSKIKELTMYIALSIGVALLLAVRLLPAEPGFMFLGISLSILTGQSFVFVQRYIHKTRLAHYSSISVALLFLLLIPLMVLPAITYMRDAPLLDENVALALEWIHQNTPAESTVLAPIEFGHAITSIAQRSNVADTNLLLAPSRSGDVQRLYGTPLPTEAVKLFTTLSIDYIVVSGEYELATSLECLRLVFPFDVRVSTLLLPDDVRIYHSLCKLEVI
ncbi:MAG TPA: hypothetical protein VJK72_02555 [Candidatus Nanoarchaeia archaeon]|nr:hypothetical protein [Candidatus Nanoarchaeia archaeon]